MNTLNSMLFAMAAAVPVLAAQAEVAPTPVNLQVGQKIAIVLEGNPTTGYLWQEADSLPADSPVKVSLTCVAPEDAGMCCGFPTPTTLTITAVKPGTQVVRVIYSRPWEKDTPPARTECFAVTVKPAQP